MLAADTAAALLPSAPMRPGALADVKRRRQKVATVTAAADDLVTSLRARNAESAANAQSMMALIAQVTAAERESRLQMANLIAQQTALILSFTRGAPVPSPPPAHAPAPVPATAVPPAGEGKAADPGDAAGSA